MKKNKELPVIELKNISLNIPIISSESKSLKNKIFKTATGGLLMRNKNSTQIQALRNINAKFYFGERIAILGHNGAGKSSFLRLISGIYFPSEGDLIKRVKVYPMIIKSFITSPELTGIHAIKAHYLLQEGNLKGFDSFQEKVIDFCELGEYINLPLKGYSEGMLNRLLFSILTTFNYECLALDEGFGASDASFFNKAQKRLEDFLDNSGTLFFASHSEELLLRFCKRALLFRNGELIFDNKIDIVLEKYHELYS